MGWLADLGAKLGLGPRVRRSLGQTTIHSDAPTRMPTGDDDDPYARPRPDEDGCMIIGKKFMPKYPFGSYRVCLTPNQEQKLFKGKRKRQKKLGCGVFACAYTAPGKTRVVKFTRDSEDVAALLQAQKTGVVPKIHAVYKLKQGGTSIETGDTTPVYALVVDRLIPLSLDERREVDENGSLFQIVDVVDGYSTADDLCGEYGCDDLTLGTLNAALKLKSIGIKWRDIHSGNIARDPKTGKVKIIDLGVTGTELKRRIKILNGLGRSRLRGSQVSLIP
jgi:hypothetical protein